MEEAKLLFACLTKGDNGKSRFHNALQSFAFRQRMEMPPDLSPVQVRKIRSPHSTGEECPLPGNSDFQLRSASPILVGMVFAGLMPEPLGPRKRVHSCALRGRTITKSETAIVAAHETF